MVEAKSLSIGEGDIVELPQVLVLDVPIYNNILTEILTKQLGSHLSFTGHDHRATITDCDHALNTLISVATSWLAKRALTYESDRKLCNIPHACTWLYVSVC